MDMQKRCAKVEKELTMIPHWSHASEKQRDWLYGYKANATDWLLHGDSWSRKMMLYYFNKLKTKNTQECSEYICGLPNEEKDCPNCDMSSRDISHKDFYVDDKLPF